MFMRRALFRDREDAGQRLAERLLRFTDEHPVVLALPRGGVPVGAQVARALHAPVGAPMQPELALGAVVDDGRAEIVLNDDIVRELRVPEDYIRAEAARQLAEIERRRRLYLGDRDPAPVAGRTAIVIDDGIATGATMEAALHATGRAEPKRLVLATPVAPPETIERLRLQVDDVVCLATPQSFAAIGQFYADFSQLSDADVVESLQSAHAVEGNSVRSA